MTKLSITTFSSLGVLLDPELSLEAQVTAVARNAFLQLRLINQLRPYLEYDCLATVTHALVTSRLDFCNALYVGLPLKTVRTLQLVQNRAARLLTGTGRYAHMTPVLRQLHWLPTEARAQFKVLIMTYKALNGLGPGYLNDRLRPYMPDRPLRSVGEPLLREHSMKEIRRVGTWRRAFSVVAPNLWNSLPKEVRLAPSLLVFRCQIQNLSFLKHNCCLTELYLNNNEIRDIAGTLRHVHSLQILLLHNNQLKNLERTVKELKGMRSLQTLSNPLFPLLGTLTEANLFNNPLSHDSRYHLYVIYHIPSVTLLDRKEISRKERESALHIYNHEKTLVLQSIGFGKRIDIPLLPKTVSSPRPTRVIHLPPVRNLSLYMNINYNLSLPRIPFANPEDAVLVRAMNRTLTEFSTIDWGKMPTCEEKRLGCNPEKGPEKLTIRFR
ncbi:Leucine-rich repeat-containing protein 72 [Varanus komodoensis]|nr:Leucine-rich repeat-containing protein 72 [Varanus komodoensis]